jgi:hypothetical protein
MLYFLQSAWAARQTTHRIDTLKKINLNLDYSVPGWPVNDREPGDIAVER